MEIQSNVRRQIEGYLDAVAAQLGGVTPQERADILGELEQHITEALRERAAEPTVADAEAVLAAMAPPESYAEAQGSAPLAGDGAGVAAAPPRRSAVGAWALGLAVGGLVAPVGLAAIGYAVIAGRADVLPTAKVLAVLCTAMAAALLLTAFFMGMASRKASPLGAAAATISGAAVLLAVLAVLGLLLWTEPPSAPQEAAGDPAAIVEALAALPARLYEPGRQYELVHEEHTDEVLPYETADRRRVQAVFRARVSVEGRPDGKRLLRIDRLHYDVAPKAAAAGAPKVGGAFEAVLSSDGLLLSFRPVDGTVKDAPARNPLVAALVRQAVLAPVRYLPRASQQVTRPTSGPAGPGPLAAWQVQRREYFTAAINGGVLLDVADEPVRCTLVGVDGVPGHRAASVDLASSSHGAGATDDEGERTVFSPGDLSFDLKGTVRFELEAGALAACHVEFTSIEPDREGVRVQYDTRLEPVAGPPGDTE